MQQEEFTVIVYHSGCPDGTTAAAIARRKNPSARLYAIRAGGSISDLENERIVMVDVSVSADNLSELEQKNPRILILDHHVTAERNLEHFIKRQRVAAPQAPAAKSTFGGMKIFVPKPTSEVRIDKSRSGATMAWDYFFPEQPRPEFVDYIEDHDLWKFALPESYPIRVAFSANNFRDVDLVNDLIDVFPNAKEDVIESGKQIIGYQEMALFPAMRDKAFHAIIDGHRAIVCPCSVLTLVSEFGAWINKQNENYDFALLWYEETLSAERKRKCMLRGKGKVDLSKIAEARGGGGHAGAAGFTVTQDEFFAMFQQTSPKIGKN